MTRTTTTNRRGRSYSYYSCAVASRRARRSCKGRHISAATLDDIILTNLKQRVLAPDRIADLLKLLIERRTTKRVCHRLLACRRN
jgi:hypothetical protein